MAAIEEHFAAANLASRQVTPASRVAKPASVSELAQRAKAALPETESLMNPRNQVTSPLPPREVLLPWVPARGESEATAKENPLGRGAAKALLVLLPELFDAKRTADLEAERRQESRPSMPSAKSSRSCA